MAADHAPRQPIQTRAPRQQPTEAAAPSQRRTAEPAGAQSPDEQAPDGNGEPREFEQPLSMQEKADIQKDPAVQEVLSLFGGKVVGFRRVSPDLPGQAEAENGEGGDESTES